MHKVHIPRRFIDRAIARRGKPEVFDALDPGKTALLVIDMQNCFLEAEFSVIEVPATRGIVANINALAAVLRAGGGLVVWTKHVFSKDWSVWYDNFAKGEWRDRMIAETAEGSFGHEIYRQMNVHPDDPQVSKYRYSALIAGSSNLEAVLREKDIDTVIITGTLTNVCCESTARDAMMLGFKTVFVADANATRSDDEHNATLVSMIQVFADVRFTDDLIRLLGGHPAHDAAAAG